MTHGPGAGAPPPPDLPPHGPTELVEDERGELVERLSSGTATLLLMWLVGVGALSTLLAAWLFVWGVTGERLGVGALFGGFGLYTALAGAAGPCILWLSGRAQGHGLGWFLLTSAKISLVMVGIIVAIVLARHAHPRGHRSQPRGRGCGAALGRHGPRPERDLGRRDVDRRPLDRPSACLTRPMSPSVTAELGGWRIEADADLNRAHYAPIDGWGCACDHCENWRAHGPRALPDDVVSFLTSLGVDVLKPHDVFEYGPQPDGSHLYGGWYHLSGRIIEGRPLPTEPTTPAHEATRLENGFRFGVYEGIGGPGAVSKPSSPQATFEFAWAVPWALTEAPSCAALLD